MPIIQRVLSMDEYFRSSDGDKIILNHLSPMALDDINKINESLITVYNNTESISTMPSCDCGMVSGRYMLGRACNSCGTYCKESYEKVKPLMWLKALNPNLKFINPIFWLILRNLLDKKTDYLRWLCDPKFNLQCNIPNHIIGLKDELGGKRSYTNVINKIPEILMYLSNHAKYKTSYKRANILLLLDMYHKQGNEIFSEYLPIINKKLFVMENTSKGKFVNLSVADVFDVVLMWVSAANDERATDKRQADSTAEAVAKLADLYLTYMKNYVVKKIGIFRKHIYGARSHFTFRSVITSMSGRHQHDEIHIPWGIAVTVFKYHILNKLIRRGYTYIEATKMRFKGVKSYHPVLDEILAELIAEAPGGRIPVILQRNPSLRQGSAQACGITKVKTNPHEATITVSALIMKACNGKNL